LYTYLIYSIRGIFFCVILYDFQSEEFCLLAAQEYGRLLRLEQSGLASGRSAGEDMNRAEGEAERKKERNKEEEEGL
jgi:hypothetical protein